MRARAHVRACVRKRCIERERGLWALFMCLCTCLKACVHIRASTFASTQHLGMQFSPFNNQW